MTAIKWDLTSVLMLTDTGAPDRLDTLLDQGWEPFAATQAGPQTAVRYHLRRPQENGRRSTP